MARTEISPGLLMDPLEADRNSLLFDGVCLRAFKIVEPIVRQMMHDDSTLGAARSELEKAKLAVRQARELAEKDSFPRARRWHDLGVELERMEVVPRHHEVLHEASAITRVVMSSWLETLRDAISSYHEVSLSQDFLPPKSSVSGEVWEAFVLNMARLSIGREGANRILRDLPSVLLTSAEGFEVPFHIVIKRDKDKIVASSKE